VLNGNLCGRACIVHPYLSYGLAGLSSTVTFQQTISNAVYLVVLGGRRFAELMEEHSSTHSKIVDISTKNEPGPTMLSIERREWWLWFSSGLLTFLMMVGIASFLPPALLSESNSFYVFSLNQAMRGLLALVLVFNVYVVYEQIQINRIRRRWTDQVYKLAILDPLTGLFNRRHIQQRLADEIARAQRRGYSLTVILFDLDAFKRVNDTYGHAAGDSVLKAFAEHLKKATRGSDMAGRYGGDEFLVVLPECKIEEVAYVLRRLDGLEVDAAGVTLPVCYSAGWADYVPGESLAEFLERADAALYVNKRNPKGRLSVPSRQFTPAARVLVGDGNDREYDTRQMAKSYPVAASTE
jgi:diguanylate cyclase (GGDEF)-like protein